MTGWIAIAISVGALAVAAFSLRETRRSNMRVEEHRKRELHAELVVERVYADRLGMGNDLLFVTLRNIGKKDAVALESSIFFRPVWYPSVGPTRTIPVGDSITLRHELAMGMVVRGPREPDEYGGSPGEPDWVLPKGGQIELRFTDASGPRKVALPLQG